MKKEKIILVLNGKLPKKSYLINFLKDYTKIICADGAANKVVKAGIKPDFIIGDLDSVQKNIALENKTIKLKNQNYNDLYKTLNWLKNKGITKLDIIGADGKRPDHMIANFDIIFKKINHFNIKIFTDYGIFYTVDKEKIFENCLNKKISIFSPDQNNKITSNGLKYELKNKQLTYLYEGSLNQAIKNKITIKTKHEIFVFISK